jgi:hypothetical protein
MSTFISEESILSFKQKGYYIFKSVIPKPHRIARSIIKEVKEIVFNREDEKEVVAKLEEEGKDPLLLLTDNKLREEYLTNPKSIWYNDNIRTPKIAKSTGMANLFFNNQVRDKVLFNEDLYNIVSTLYSVLSGKEEDCIYLYGPERVCVKPQGSTHMPKHIDCDITCYKENTDLKHSPQTHPLSMFRVQTITCLQIDTEEKNNGRTDLLSGYNNYFLLGAYFFRKIIPKPKEEVGHRFTPVVVQEIFSKHLDSFLEHINDLYDKKGKLLPKEDTPYSKERSTYERIYNSLPKKKIKIEWIQPVVEPGDVLCFDQRLPHRNTKNDSPISRVVCFASFYPKSYWQEGDLDIYRTFRGKKYKSREYNDGSMEREAYENVWEERCNFQLTPHIRKILAVE